MDKKQISILLILSTITIAGLIIVSSPFQSTPIVNGKSYYAFTGVYLPGEYIGTITLGNGDLGFNNVGLYYSGQPEEGKACIISGFHTNKYFFPIQIYVYTGMSINIEGQTYFVAEASAENLILR